MAKEQQRTTVLYIAGNGRSGSTILDVVLGQCEGYFAVGEVRRAWNEDVLSDSLCGCGQPFNECTKWKAIFEEAFGGISNVDAERMSRLNWRFCAQKNLLTPSMGRRPSRARRADLEWFLGNLSLLYASIQRVSGARVIVDASKWPLYGHMLGLLPSVDLKIVHLVRDPRAVAYSWTRVKEFQPGVLLPRQSPFKTTAYWLALNPSIRRFWSRTNRYYFLPYERLVASPRSVVRELLDFAGTPDVATPFIDEHTATLDHTHAVAGNEVRLNRGHVQLRLDSEWRERMPVVSRALVTAMTLPFLARYGYLGDKRPATPNP